MRGLLAGVLLVTAGAVPSAQRPQVFSGVVTDDLCAGDAHAGMRMGPTDADCTRLCVLSHGAKYVLLAGKTVYLLSDQAAPEAFAAQRVRVVGVLDEATRTIRVDSIAAES